MTVSRYMNDKEIVSALELTLLNIDECEGFIGGDAGSPPGGGLLFATREGALPVSLGDFIVRDDTGKFYTCKPDVFLSTHEKIKP